MKLSVAVIGPDIGLLAHSLGKAGESVAVVRECQEFAELIATCQSGAAQVAVVAGGTGDVTMTLVDRLLAVGVGVVGLSDDDGERQRLEGLGALAAPVDLSIEELAEVFVAAANQAARAAGTRALPTSSFSAAGSPVREAPPGAASHATRGGGHDQEPERRGQLIAFWGPIGSPGRTTLAVNAAAELVSQGRRVILVDADTYGPSIAAHLGLLEESAGIAQACRLADQGILARESLERCALQVVTDAGELRVLTGITRADRWHELRPASLSAVLDACLLEADFVVVDCAFCLEADEELSFDTVAPRRNGATLRILEMAHRVIAVGAADAIGMPRLVRALQELENAVPSAAPEVVFNKVRRSALGRFPDRALRDAWHRFGPGRPITALVPLDTESADRALLSGQILLEAAPKSELRRAIAETVCPPAQRNRRSAV